MRSKFEMIILDRVESCRRMFDGERLYLDNEGLSYAAFNPDFGFKIKSAGSDGLDDIVGLFHDKEISWYIKKEWYESIPVHGVLCNVSDTPDQLIKVRLVVKCIDSGSGRGTFILDSGERMVYAEPLTDKEIKQFLRGE